MLEACRAKVGLTQPTDLGPAPSSTLPTPGQTTQTETAPPPSTVPTPNPSTSTVSPPTSTSGVPSDLSTANPAVVDNSNLPITPVEGIGITATPPDLDISNYVLSVDGLVKTPLSLSYQELLRRPAITEVLLLVCPGFFGANPEWSGVPVSALLSEAGVMPEAAHVTVHAIDGDRQAFELGDMQSEGVFLAYQVDGQTLPKEHGYPVRLVVKGMYGAFWVKWVSRIEVT